MPIASREYRLKFTPPGVTVAPRGELLPLDCIANCLVPRSGFNLAFSNSLLCYTSDMETRSGTRLCAIATDQVVRRAVMIERRVTLTLQLRDDTLRQHFAQLHAPLVE